MRCIYCNLPADRRCRNVAVLPDGRRLHQACHGKLLTALVQAMTEPRQPAATTPAKVRHSNPNARNQGK